MAKKARKKAIKKSLPKLKTASFKMTCSNGAVQFEQLPALSDREAESRVTAIQAVRDTETETLLSQLRLFRSYFSTEQLQMHALQFFKENLPNVSVLKNENCGVFELEWKKDDCVITNHVTEKNMRTSLGSSTTLPPMRGPRFSTRSVERNFLDAVMLQVPDFDFGESSENQILGLRNAFETPGASSDRLSVGMIPKTLRLPKHGEMLLSIRGSPLGVYREENLEPIRELEDGSHDGATN